MPSPNVDLVLVVDASASMQPCFEALRAHLNALLMPIQGNSGSIRFGLVTMSCGTGTGGGIVYDVASFNGGGLEWVQLLYKGSLGEQEISDQFFTKDPKRIVSALERLTAHGDEDMLLALDIAADFPFGPLSNTKRVIALFSDEPFETGISGDASNKQIDPLRNKLMARHIQLFLAVPDGSGAQALSEVDRCEAELIPGGDGLRSVDFNHLLGQMAKSISGSSLQSVREPEYQRALYGQDKWAFELLGRENMKEYKVLLKYSNFLFSKDDVETELNAYAQQGWKVIASSISEYKTLHAQQTIQIYTVMERERKQE